MVSLRGGKRGFHFLFLIAFAVICFDCHTVCLMFECWVIEFYAWSYNDKWNLTHELLSSPNFYIGFLRCLQWKHNVRMQMIILMISCAKWCNDVFIFQWQNCVKTTICFYDWYNEKKQGNFHSFNLFNSRSRSKLVK